MDTFSSKWLFDYNQGSAYEAFSKSEDYGGVIANYIKTEFNLDGMSILEIGAGSGKFTPILAEKCREIIVVERSHSLMEINKQKNSEDARKSIEFILADVKDVSFPDASFDVIFAGWSLTSMRDSFDVILPLLRKWLKPNGKMIIVENAGNDDFSKIMGINDLSHDMASFYKSIGFIENAILDTNIILPSKEVFYNAFPEYKTVELETLRIKHRVLIMSYTNNDGGRL